jgi:hypothetical protein
MSILKRTVIIGILLAMPLHAGSEATSTAVQPAAADKAVSAVPAYKPPLRGAPAGRVGGGTRGATERESFALQVLAPDHLGYTVREQPCLYWYISNPTTHPLELTVTERNAVAPLLEKTMQASAQGGIQSACLADYGVKLRKDVQYKWFVTLVTDPERRSKDILAGGMLMVVDPQPLLAEKLKSAVPGSLPNIYAEEGLWYDAIGALSQLIEETPANLELHRQRAALLEQVGLAEVAAYENGQAK